MLQELMSEKRLIVCAGSGGVGKTTVSAALALSAALQGKKALVVTIDPARRLANALGFEEFGNEEFEVDLSTLTCKGEPVTGQLFAMMLDQKLTFDTLVERYAPDAGSAQRLMENRWYQQMSSALAGAQDYMAVEKLYEMAQERDYDLIVLDTPPTTNALDFLEAPQRLMDMLQLQPIQWFRKGVGGGGTASRWLRWGWSSLIKALGRVVGGEVVEELSTLLQDMSILYDGFKERAGEMWGLLRSDECGFFLVSAPNRSALKEALFFHHKLLESGMPFSGIWLNRVRGFYQDKHTWSALPQQFSRPDEEALEVLAKEICQDGESLEDTVVLLRDMSRHFGLEFQEVEQARKEVVFLREQLGEEPFIGLLPLIQEELHELAGLAHVGQLLLDDGVGPLLDEAM